MQCPALVHPVILTQLSILYSISLNLEQIMDHRMLLQSSPIHLKLLSFAPKLKNMFEGTSVVVEPFVKPAKGNYEVLMKRKPRRH
jgi:hypothetical protein